MYNFIPVSIPAKNIALIIETNAIPLEYNWDNAQAVSVMRAILNTDIDSIIQKIDHLTQYPLINSSNVPQFGNFEALFSIPSILVNAGSTGVNTGQLGFLLKQDPNSSISANRKFGENHGKAATLIGLAKYADNMFFPTSLSYAFSSFSKDEQKQIIRLLFFRIPIIQLIIKQAPLSGVFIHKELDCLSESTRIRRVQTIKLICRELYDLNNADLTNRLDTIIWE